MNQIASRDAGGVDVLLLEDEAAGRLLMTEALAACGRVTRIDAATSIACGRRALAEKSYDLLLADLNLPDGSGLALVRQARALTKPPLVLVVSSISDDASIVAAIAAGACGYACKFDAPEDIARSIAIALDGGATVTPAIAHRLIALLRANAPRQDAQCTALTPREQEILTLASKGYSYRQIAELGGGRPSTVYCHVRHIYEKMHVSNLPQALFEARAQGLL
ncbi:MAG: response regulator transcription factor [Tahibacter sp.]